jgi:hypothetical protein
LAVEHIQPKGLAQYEALVGKWDNFLLGCVNCNSTKKDKDVELDKVFLPDRDNTFYVFSYSPDGKIFPASCIKNTPAEQIALATLALTGLDKPINETLDENGRLVALDRVSQRMQAWAIAEEAKADLQQNSSIQVKNGVIRTAIAEGFFSIWMTVLANDQDICNRLIDAFVGARDSGCFDASAHIVLPAPNPDNLPHGGKI